MNFFLWRARRNAIPTKQALMKRTIISDPTCERCKVDIEDQLHALWSCSEVDIVWADLTLWDFRSSVNFVDFKQLVSWIVEEGKQLELFVYMAWLVWNQRNQVRVRVPATALHQLAEVSRTNLNDAKEEKNLLYICTTNPFFIYIEGEILTQIIIDAKKS